MSYDYLLFGTSDYSIISYYKFDGYISKNYKSYFNNDYDNDSLI